MTHANQTKKFWQFSIREFLLAVIAVASLVALYANQRTFQQTSFSDLFSPNSVMEKAFRDLGVTGQGGVGGGGNSGSDRVTLTYRGTYQPIEGTTQSDVMLQIRSVLQQQIVDCDCRLNGSILSKTTSADNILTDFEIAYRNRNANGLIRVRSSRNEYGDWQFWFDIFEY